MPGATWSLMTLIAFSSSVVGTGTSSETPVNDRTITMRTIQHTAVMLNADDFASFAIFFTKDSGSTNTIATQMIMIRRSACVGTSFSQ